MNTHGVLIQHQYRDNGGRFQMMAGRHTKTMAGQTWVNVDIMKSDSIAVDGGLSKKGWHLYI